MQGKCLENDDTGGREIIRHHHGETMKFVKHGFRSKIIIRRNDSDGFLVGFNGNDI